MRLLVVEDEFGLADAIERGLKQDGYAVDIACDGEEALDFAHVVDYDVIILDLMLPKKSGLEVLKQLRSEGSTVPVLILTARDTVQDKVAGLDTGADDYLTKPFSFDELTARIRALLRRRIQATNSVFRIADLVIDTASHKVTRAGEEVQLTVKEYALLEYLAHNRGQVLSRAQIEEHAWDQDYLGNSNIVDVYISYLRKKLDDDHAPKLIETVRGWGYRLRDPK